ncbi:MAG: hypothetical protein CSA22_04240 [Deltaproteobacteria bacterium]|nr:MAG: hypothetical protein CSA22_04240 [Deltaproteobacteria bacterium]
MLFRIETLFDRIARLWESGACRRVQGGLLLLAFFISLCLIEAARWNLLPGSLQIRVSTNHLVAVEVSFTLLLVFESVGLVFSFVQSITASVGKQFEILSLILLRGTFKQIADVGEPLTWDKAVGILPDVGATAMGALIIFAVICVYQSMAEEEPVGIPKTEAGDFIRVKKGIALVLLFSFAWICLNNLVTMVLHGHPERVFERFFTVLIFSDVLMVLIALIYTQNYRIAFRNSAFAVAAVVIRVALVAPMALGAGLGVVAVFYVLAVVVVFQRFEADPDKGDDSHRTC